MAWLDAFRTLKQQESSFDSVLLRDRLPLVADGQRLAPSLIERVSGILASHLPKQLREGEKCRLIFVLPNATQNLGRFLAVSLLLADFVHRQEKSTNGNQNALLNGDLLLITQHIRSCVGLLREVALRYHSEKLPIAKFWPIEVLSQYAPPADTKPRVFVANPGWASVLGEQRVFGSVVIDVSHPRTSDHLDTLLRQPSIASAPIQILVTPPWEQTRIEALQEKDRPSDLVWAWDPAAVDALEQLVAPNALAPQKDPSERFIWLSDDTDVEDCLVELHSLLVGAMKAVTGRVPQGVLEAWGTYHKLRQLAVPLVTLEEERRETYQTPTIQERIRALNDDPPEGRGALGSYLDARWPRVITALKTLYDILLCRKEPAKFYTLACVVEELLEKKASEALRIVVPTTHEANMLAALLGEIVGSWADALQSGAVSLTTLKEEPRLIAEGVVQPTVLLGFRTSQTRYLDVYPGIPVHVVAYPYEAEVDDGIQHRIHASIESLQENGPRTVVLKQLRIGSSPLLGSEQDHGRESIPRSKRAESRRRFEVQPREPQQRRFLDEDAIEPLNLQSMVGQSWFEEVGSYESTEHGDRSRRPLQYCEVTDTSGEKYRFPVGRLIDVFRPAIEQRERIAAGELESGMLMVRLVDDPYEDLFQRMLEAIREQRDVGASMALALWDRAKPAALTKYGGSRTRLHRALDERGLSVDYAAVVGWYRSGEEEILAPGKREDFELLARASGIYTDASLLNATYNCIQRERVVRRTCGKQLTRLLSHLAAGKHYEVALKSAGAIDTALEHVAAAVSLREVESVRLLGSHREMFQ